MSEHERIEEALAELRAEVLDTPSAPAQMAARQTMHAAVAASPPGWRRRLSWRPAAAFGTAALCGAVVAAGWTAPPGSWLWPVRNTREHVTIALASQRASAECAFAESLLSDAAGGRNPAAALAAASAALDDCHRDLPTDATSPLWARWRADEAELQKLESPATPSPAPASTPPAGRGPEPTERPSESGSGEHETAAPQPTSGDGSDGGATATPAPSDGSGSLSTPSADGDG